MDAPRLATVTVADGVEPVLAHLATDGGVVVRDFLDADLVARFRADMERHAAALAAGTRAESPAVQAFWGARTIRFTRLAARSASFVEILTHPLFLAVADRLLLPHAADYWMNTGQMMIIGPGERAQVLHRDADNWPDMNRPDGPEVTISCMFAISDFTEDNGATVVVPGSHQWPDFGTRATPAQCTRAVMPAGSGLLYTGRVMHGGGANVTADEWRLGLHLSYVLGWLVPEEAAPLGTPWGHVAGLPERAQRLLGWRCYAEPRGSRLWTVDYEDVPVGLDLT